MPTQEILTVNVMSKSRMRYALLQGMVNDGEYRDLLTADFNRNLAKFIEERIPVVPPLPPPGGNGVTKRRKSKKKKRTKRKLK